MVFYKSPPPYHPQMTVGEKNHTKGKAVGKQAEAFILTGAMAIIHW